MPRKKQFQWDSDIEMETEGPQRKSRSQKKRESTALQELGESLAKLPMKVLEDFPLSPALLAAFRDLRGIKSNEARRRHLQYIGRLMRESDEPEAIEEAFSSYRARIGQ